MEYLNNLARQNVYDRFKRDAELNNLHNSHFHDVQYRLGLMAANQSAAAALQASQQQQQQHSDGSLPSSSIGQSSISSASSTYAQSVLTNNISSQHGQNSRRRPSLLPQNTPQGAEAYNLALTNSSISNNSNGPGGGISTTANSNAQNRTQMYSDREKYVLSLK